MTARFIRCYLMKKKDNLEASDVCTKDDQFFVILTADSVSLRRVTGACLGQAARSLGFPIVRRGATALKDTQDITFDSR